MDYNYTLKYRTFDSLLEDVKLDLGTVSLENRISPEQLIKVARRCNYDLGLRINMTKERVLEICNGKAKLPDDFYVMNFALMCGEYTRQEILPQGTVMSEIPFPNYRETVTPAAMDACALGPANCRTCGQQPCGCDRAGCSHPNECGPLITPPYDPAKPYGDYCVKPRVFLNCKGEAYELIQELQTETRTYKYLYPIRFVASKYVDCECPNLGYMRTMNEGYIKDGYLYVNVKEANVYINYQGELEDEEGNLMVPDHPEINEYYEYSLKERIFENLTLAGDNFGNQFQLASAKVRPARNYALTIVNTPNFSEMYKVWAMNRKAMYSKYYDMFKWSYWPIGYQLNNIL